MDRRSALDVLELIRPDANELRHPDFADALAYLETDEKAREVFARRQEEDRQVAEAMQSVPVPEDLKARLLSAIAPEPKSEIAETPAPNRTSRRRWMLSASVVAAACLLAGLGIWFFGEAPETRLALQELEAEVPFEADEVARLPRFSGAFQPAKPYGPWMSENHFAFSAIPKGFAPDSENQHRVAVYEFYFRDPEHRHPGDLRGVMLVVPKSELQESPESLNFFDGAYITHPAKPRVAIRSWTEGDRVFVCLVPIQHFEALSRAFDEFSLT